MTESIHQQLLACPREVRQYVLEQAAEIERLRAELDAANNRFHEMSTPTQREMELKWQLQNCRRLLREIRTAPMQIGCDSLHVSVSTDLYKRINEAAKAGGGE